jgi:hypothetical protein
LLAVLDEDACVGQLDARDRDDIGGCHAVANQREFFRRSGGARRQVIRSIEINVIDLIAGHKA